MNIEPIRIWVAKDGETAHEVIVEKFPCSIGRGRDSSLVLDNWRVGKCHATIERSERILRLIDGGTLTGTWVNGNRIAEYAPLSEHDQIQIAGYHLRVGLQGIDLIPEQRNLDHIGSSEVPAFVGIRDIEKHRHHRMIRREVYQKMLRTIDLRRKDVRQLSDLQLRDELSTLLSELLNESAPEMPGAQRVLLIDELLSEALGLGPLDPLLVDPAVTEIMVNGHKEVFVERNGNIEQHASQFSSDEAVRIIIDRIVQPIGRRIDDASPMVDARLPDGSRLNAIIPPLSLIGPSITIRKFNQNLLTPELLLEAGGLSEQMLAFLKICVERRKNIVVSGGTGAGKTTLLNILSTMIPAGERIITIEDSAELKLTHRNLVSLESRPINVEGRGGVTIRDLVRNALRMRPDRIVVGEVRSGEALDMLQAMNTGHDGSLTTVHANSGRDVFSRLEVMSLMAGIDIPILALREQIASAVDIVVQQVRLANGKRRISSILEVTGLESGRIQAQELFRYEPVNGGRFVSCGLIPEFYEALQRNGEVVDLNLFERPLKG